MKPSLTLTGPDQAFYMPFGLNELPQPQLPSAFGFCTTCAADCSPSAQGCICQGEAQSSHTDMVCLG